MVVSGSSFLLQRGRQGQGILPPKDLPHAMLTLACSGRQIPWEEPPTIVQTPSKKVRAHHKLLMIELLHDLTYQDPRKDRIPVHMGLYSIHFNNSRGPIGTPLDSERLRGGPGQGRPLQLGGLGTFGAPPGIVVKKIGES